MKKRSVIVTATTFAASCWATAVIAQEPNTEIEAGLGAEARAGLNADVALEPVLRASDVLVERAVERYDELPEELQEDVEALEAALSTLRETWVNEYKPAIDASAEQVIAAREQFRVEMAEEIEASVTLRKELVAQLRDEIRERLEDEEGEGPPEFAKRYRELGLEIRKAWREARAALGSDATEEDIAVAKEAFLEANAEVIAERQEIAAEMRVSGGASAAIDRPVAVRPSLPEAVQQLKEEMQAARAEVRARRQDAREELADLSEEEREVRRQELIAELRVEHEALKERRRQLVQDLRNEHGGDRRSED